MSTFRKTRKEIKAASPWDKLLAFDARERCERGGYAVACELDKIGRYTEADEALRLAGRPEETIRDRRRHLEWRTANGYSVTGDTLTKVNPEGDSQ
jgi:hypothetical protein